MDTDYANLVKMAGAFQDSQLLYTSCSLGLFETLATTSEPLSCHVLSNRLKTDYAATERLLNACVSLNFLEKVYNNDGIAVYENSKLAQRYLVKNSPTTLKWLIATIGDRYTMWENLQTAVKTGSKQLNMRQMTADSSGSNDSMFENGRGHFSDGKRKLDFLQAMHNFSKIDAPLTTKAFNLDEFSTACDIGGGTGILGYQLAKEYPQMKVFVFDLPHVIKLVNYFLPDLLPNLCITEGDVFEGSFPDADLYILSHVLHDWNEDKIDSILSMLFQALPIGGGLLVLEKFLNDQKVGSLETIYFDIGLLLASDGKERTSAEYTTILERNGFSDIETKVLPNAMFHDAILARKY